MMSLLLPVLLKTACPSTHHKLAIDALRFLRGESADAWRDLFLRFHKPLLAGAKAPDDDLKDYGNHVLHVGDRPWGGAAAGARERIDQLVAALAERRWMEGAAAAGMLSHYVSEPFMPLNTRQSEAGNLVQPGIEWCVSRSYGQLQSILEDDLGGYPDVEAPRGTDGIEPLLKHGAEMASQHYDVLVEHFDFARVLFDPEEGLDQESQDSLALCLGAAVIAFARMLDMAIEQAASEPPKQQVSPSGLVATLKAPFRLLSCHTYDQLALRQLEAMHEELELTGRVAESLPTEQREIRRLYAEEVLRVPVAELVSAEPVRCGQNHGKGAAPRYRPNKLRGELSEVRPTSSTSRSAALLGGRPAGQQPAILKLAPRISRGSPIEDAPLLTPKQAVRLRATAIDTIGDLLAADPQFLAERLRLRGDEARLVDQWQAAARQACGIPAVKREETNRRNGSVTVRKAA